MTDSDLASRRYADGFPPGTSPQVEAFLRDQGLPTRVATIFRAAEALHPLEPDEKDDRPLPDGIVVGYSQEDDELFVSPSSGEVRLYASRRDAPTSPVNRDLASFAACLRLVAQSHPFTLEVNDIEHASAFADALRARLVAVDPSCVAEPDGYWALFLEDVAVGDYS